MSEPLVERVSFRDSDHTYFLEGKRIPSVTTLLGNLSKPGLVWWSAKEGAAAVQARVLELGDEIESGLVNVEGFASELYELARTAHAKRKNKAAAKGNVVHAAIERYHSDFFNAAPPDEDTPARVAWDAFIEWFSGSGLRVVSTERKIVCPQGRYAGRLDLLLQDGELPIADHVPDLFVADIKTSNGVYSEMVLQNAGYADAIEHETGRQVAGTKVLWLPEGADKLIVIERDREEWKRDFEIFEALIDIHHHRNALDRWLKDVKAEHGPQEPTE